jgi:predicted transcriptional regulator
MEGDKRLTKKDRAVFSTLYLARRPLPVKRIASKADISWKTANSSIGKLSTLGFVTVERTRRRTRASLRGNVLALADKRMRERKG